MFLRLWCFILLIKLIVGALIPLSADEAYYWVWTHFPQLSYFDHPPMVAWLFTLGKMLPLWAVRWPAILLGHLTLWLWFLILRPILPESKLRWTWILLCLLPLTGLGSIILTPDLPLLFFWSASTYFFINSLSDPDKKSNWLFLGISLGLGFCSKYIVVLFPIFALSYVTFEKRWRQIGLRNFVYVLVTALIFSFPVWYWNMQHDWASFKFQLSGRYTVSRFSSAYFLFTYLGGQLLAIFPALIFLATRTIKEKNLRLLHWLTWGPIVFFAIMSWRGPVEPNWVAVSHLSMVALAVAGASQTKWLKITAWFWGPLIFSVLALVILQKVPASLSKLAEPYQFQNLAKASTNYQPLYASTYQMASQLWFETQKPTYKLAKMSRYDFFDEMTQSTPKEDKFYLARFDYEVELPTWITQNFTIRKVDLIDGRIEILEILKK